MIALDTLTAVNIPPKLIADFMSECLVLDALGDDKVVILLTPNLTISNGLRIR